MSTADPRRGFHCPKCQLYWHDATLCPHCDGVPHVIVPPRSIFDEAEHLINGDRRDAYGDYNDEAAYIAAGWEALRRGGPITARHVPLMMMWLKMVRESYKPGVDNRRDTAGYLGLLDKMMSSEALKPSTAELNRFAEDVRHCAGINTVEKDER